MTRRKRWCIILVSIARRLMCYVSLYVYLRTGGVRRAASQSSPGFYFVEIREHADFKLHQCLLFLFYPLYLIDRIAFNGSPAGAEPLMNLHKETWPAPRFLIHVV